MRRGDDDLGIAQRQVADDVVADRGRRGGRQAEDATGLELLEPLSEREIGGTEIVAPFRDAVRLVDRDQGGRNDLEQAAELVAGERLGRGEDEERAALRDACQTLAAIGDAHRAVEADRRHAELLHLEILVLEQREQRRDDHRGLRQEQRRKLVAERLAAAGGHDEQRVAPGEHRADRALLLAVQSRDPEALARRSTDLVETDRGGCLQVCAFQGLHRAPVRWRPGREDLADRLHEALGASYRPRLGVCLVRVRVGFWARHLCARPSLQCGLYLISRGKSTLVPRVPGSASAVPIRERAAWRPWRRGRRRPPSHRSQRGQPWSPSAQRRSAAPARSPAAR